MKKLILCLLIICLVGCSSQTVEEKPQSEVSVVATGDLLFEQGLYDWSRDYDMDPYFEKVRPLLQSDLTIGNQEVPIGGQELGVSGVAYTFNAPYQIAEELKEAGFNFLTLANNHTMDMSTQGIYNTRKILKEKKIQNTGMYISKEDRYTIRVIEKKGIKIAVLAYTYGTNQMPNYAYEVPYFLNEYGQFDEEHQKLLRKDIEVAKRISDVVLVSMHWGNEFTYELTSVQKEVAAFLNEEGVDVVLGNHSHCIQPAETLTSSTGNQTIVFYSLGNFVSSAALVDRASPDFQNMYEVGAVARFTIKKDEGISIENVEIVPVVNHFEHGYTNFQLIPFKDYSEQMAKKHYQKEFNENFTKSFLSEQIHYVYDSSGFLESEI